MPKLTDLATSEMTTEEKKAVRKAAWKRPTTKAKRESLRDERIIEARGYRNADSNSIS